MRDLFRLFFSGFLAFFLTSISVYACTSMLVSRGASTDGSVMISWTYDVTGFMSPLHFYPGGVHNEGDSLNLYCFREKKYLGRIKQVPETYKVVGNMNIHQVAIGETTFTGRKELHEGEGVFDYGNLIYTTLQRARTAREAIKIMDELSRIYGYKDTGESFSIMDKNEAWILEFIGRGKFGKGALWVAARVPDGYIAAHANQARIRKIDWNDTENWMWSEDIVDFARNRGWFNGKDEDFSFVDVYDPVSPRSLLLCESRVWSIYRRAAPSAGYTADYWRCVEGAEPYPLFIKPDKKLSIEDVIAMHRDHFHDTPYYSGEVTASEPYGNPYRWRPVFFELPDDTMVYGWERPISQPQTAFSYISQARSNFPDEIGGICWYALDDNFSNVWMPLYLAMDSVPPSIAGGSPIEFDWNSAYWVFSLLNNYTYGMYNQIMPDIQKVQKELEDIAIQGVAEADKKAMEIYKTSPQEMRDYLTEFSVYNVEFAVERWRKLAFYIFVKYNDGYRREEMRIDSWPKGVGYPEEYNRRAVEERPGYYDVRWRKAGEKID